MYEILRFTKLRLASPSLISELSQRIKENEIPILGEMFALAQQEIVKACRDLSDLQMEMLRFNTKYLTAALEGAPPKKAEQLALAASVG